MQTEQQTTTTGAEGAIFAVEIGAGGGGVCSLRLSEVEPRTIEMLQIALAALKEADSITERGQASDHMHNAADEIRRAVRMVGG
jgi:hypothetical protein